MNLLNIKGVESYVFYSENKRDLDDMSRERGERLALNFISFSSLMWFLFPLLHSQTFFIFKNFYLYKNKKS